MEKNLERIADALEKIANLMEDANYLKRRHTIGEMNEKRQQAKLDKKNKRQITPNVDSFKVRKIK